MLQLPLLASKIETKHLMKTGAKVGHMIRFGHCGAGIG